MKILITGGAGYLGSILTPTLLEQGHHVTVLDSFLFNQTSLLDHCHNPNLTVVRGDSRDKATLLPLLSEADCIIPLAALVGMPACNEDRIGASSTNLDAIKLLCDNISPEQRIITPTTNSGYGIGETDTVCTEASPLRPISHYGVTKVEAEKVVLDRGNSISLRLATVFGLSPRMRMDLLVNDFVYRAINDKAIVLFEANFKRNYIHIRDVAAAFIHSLNNFEKMKNEAYNVGLEEANLSKLELCHLIKEFVPALQILQAPIGQDPDQRNYIVSNQKILSTGFQPQWLIADGIQELLKGYTILKHRLGNV